MSETRKFVRNTALGLGLGTAAVLGLLKEGHSQPLPASNLAHEVTTGQVEAQPSNMLVALFGGVNLHKTPTIPVADLGQRDNVASKVPEGKIMLLYNPSQFSDKAGKTWLITDSYDKEGHATPVYVAESDLLALQAGGDGPNIEMFNLNGENQPSHSSIIDPSELVANTAGLTQFPQQ